MRHFPGCVLVAGAALYMSASANPLTLGDLVTGLTRDARWTLVSAVPMAFDTYHPQGMVKIGTTLYISSVEVRVPTRRLPQVVGGYDRDTGEGVGHLFRVDAGGHLLARVVLGEGTMYHPGGMDFDGTHIWVSAAEYRPNSRSIVYRVQPSDLEATEVFRVEDHLGAVVRDRQDGSLHGVSWGSRRLYRWRLSAGGELDSAAATPDHVRQNASHYVDYQDCQYAGQGRMLCGGVADLRGAPDDPPYRLGGIDLVDLADGRPVHQVPLALRTSGGRPMTQNPLWLEAQGETLRAYFLPEDNTSTLYIYEVTARE